MFLVGKRIALRPLLPEDANSEYVSWLNDAEVCAGNSHHVFPYTPSQASEYIKRVTGSSDSLVLAITGGDTNKHIGNVALQSIHPVHRSAEFAILIGDKDSWSSGFGREAATLIIDHGFNALNLERIHCGTFATNLGMQKLASSLGMTEVGRLRKAAFKNGRFVDILLYDLLRIEWRNCPI